VGCGIVGNAPPTFSNKHGKTRFRGFLSRFFPILLERCARAETISTWPLEVRATAANNFPTLSNNLFIFRGFVQQK
jgi:hypothetical protein